MKRISDILFSSKTMIVLLVVMAIAMGTGTIIEDKYDTLAAKNLIYNSKWFELLFLLLAFNFLGHIKSFNMLRKERVGGVIFHLSFVLIILGAGITRYFGTEGNIHIREGETSNTMTSSDPCMQISFLDDGKSYNRDYPANFGTFSGNKFHVEIPFNANGNIDIRCKECIENAEEKINENVTGGVDIIEIIAATDKGRERIFVKKGEIKKIDNLLFSYDNDVKKDALSVIEKNNVLYLVAPDDILQSNMMDTERDTIEKDTVAEFKSNYVYTTQGARFLFSKFYKSASIMAVSSGTKESGFNALLLDVSINGKKHDASILYVPGQLGEFKDFLFDGFPLKIAYGKKNIELPFSIRLNDFILERYAASESPSSYASEVTVVDNRTNIKKDQRIFMNNILDYDNYRFFQSSYDPDEKGTILSVNHDFWGTWTSYSGYFLLTIGFIVTLFNKQSRFLTLRRNIIEIRKERKLGVLTIALIMGFSTFAFSNNSTSPAVDAVHSEKFGLLITQASDGRFEPVHSLAYDVLHKISRKDKFKIDGKGEMGAMQVFIDMMLDPEFWKQQKMVYIKEQSVRDVLGINTKEASFLDFFDADSKYKLQKFVDDAFRKKPVERNNFDKEIIKVDERLNVFMMVFQATILEIFPEPDAPNNKWFSWNAPAANIPLKGIINVMNDDLKLRTFNYSSIMQLYFREVEKSVQSGDYVMPEKILSYISKMQRQNSGTNLLPSESKLKAEIFYNKAQIFIVVKNWYGGLSLFLLLFAFIDNVRMKKSKLISILLNIGIVLLALAFIYQTFGMALRSYLLGYAPWSNGYEALILVAWGTLLAGFTFVRYSKITLAATALLAFFVLMTAGHSSYDPQLTNLTPVLKSYWLIIHVAILTISYGFLGLGFIVGIINLFIYLFKTKKNNDRLDLLILELTYINEMNLTIGIVLATVGTFLGGVWANESWGRYWGWDAKETWALVIVVTYTLLLHLRFIPKLNGKYIFNVGAVLSFGSVLMTFFGVNYFLSKGMHSYGAGDTAIFPVWAWVIILGLAILMIAARLKERMVNNFTESE